MTQTKWTTETEAAREIVGQMSDDDKAQILRIGAAPWVEGIGQMPGTEGLDLRDLIREIEHVVSVAPARTTAENITRIQIARLGDSAGEAGDMEQVEICEIASNLADPTPEWPTRGDAIAECARVINAAEAMADEGDDR